ncbi:MAG: hypothetical protein IT374_24130 [Polyangiaceae bacterium]|nr:hypothetical protein [Polyangiaceae bacterium]
MSTPKPPGGNSEWDNLLESLEPDVKAPSIPPRSESPTSPGGEDHAGHDEHDERTVIGVIPREIMAESMRGGAMRGGGLSQLLARGRESEPAPPAEPAPDLFTSARVPPPPPRPASPQRPAPPRAPVKTAPSLGASPAPPDARHTVETLPSDERGPSIEHERPTVPPPPGARDAAPSVESADVESAPGPKLHEPETREFEPDEATMIGPASFRMGASAPSPLDEPTSLEDLPTAAPEDSAPESLPPPSAPPAPVSPWRDERDASTHLGEQDQLESWLERAAWLEAEARALEDRQARARGLLVASELSAMAGDEARAEALAGEARELSPQHPLVLRQLRGRATRDRDVAALSPLVEAEGRSAPTPAGRLHAALFGAALARAAGDEDTATKRLEQAARVSPADPRAHVERVSGELATPEKPPRHRIPDVEALQPLAGAVAELAALRGDERAVSESPAVSLVRARAALGAEETAAAVAHLSRLGSLAGIGEGARWLAAALAAPKRDLRATSRELLSSLTSGDAPTEARRALAARSLELGESGAALSLDAVGSPFTPAERAALAALLGRDEAAGAAFELGSGPFVALGAAVQAALGVPALPEGLGSAEAREAVALGRAFAVGDPDPADAIGPELTRALSLDAAARAGEPSIVSSLLGSDGSVDRCLAAAVAALDDEARTRALGKALVEAAPDLELGARLAGDADDLSALAARVDDPVRSSLLLLELALRAGEDAGEALLQRAHDAAPELPMASSVGAHLARRRGDAEALVKWVKARREAASDASEAAPDLVREALLTAGDDGDAARSALEEAARSAPSDLALADLIERFQVGTASGRGAALLARAEAAPEAARTRIALIAALELERDGDAEAAAKAAAIAAPTSPLAALVRDRLDTLGTGAARLAEELMATARAAESPEAEREAYERLAYLDEVGRGDVASALLWHRSILERDPGALVSLRRLEHALVGEGREEELEPILTAIARAIDGAEALAHARVAHRLRQRDPSAGPSTELLEVAGRVDPGATWALRQRVTAATGDAPAARRGALEALAAQTPRPLEKATLLLRAAELARDAGDTSLAAAHLRAAVELAPDHAVARRVLAQLLAEGADGAATAEALEAAAAASGAVSHQVELRFEAAVSWLDRASDRARGLAALETVLEAAPTHEAAFDRLRALFLEAGDQDKLASLLERRLDTEADPGRRVELEVARGRALASLGQTHAARAALSSALLGSPDHVDALLVFAELSGQDGDWEGAEQSLIRLARLAPDPAQQAEIYLQLGAIYRAHLPNPERALAAYVEVQRRAPGHVGAQEALVAIFAEQRDAARAIEAQSALLAAATDPAEKRRRTVELARLHEEVGGDVRKAEQMLEALRKEAPADPLALRALAELNLRHGRGPAVNVLLDRAANDARRALGTGRFELPLFTTLATVFALRGNADASRVAQSTVAALEGHDGGVEGIGARAGQRELVELVAPEVFTPAFRELLRQAGAALDGATPSDLKGLRATPFPVSSSDVQREVLELAQTFGVMKPEVLVSTSVGPVAMPVSSSPPTLVLGAALVSDASPAVRRFLVVRALTVLRGHAAAFARTAPIDLWPMTAAFLQTFAPSWSPQSVDAGKLADFRARIGRALPTSGVGAEAGALALEVIGTIGNKASTLQTAANSWGTRVALLSEGDLSVGLDALAFAAGQGAAPTGPDRVKWIGRHAEARDLVVFSVSNEHAEARKG